MLKNKGKIFNKKEENNLFFIKHKIDNDSSLEEFDDDSETDFFEKPIMSSKHDNEKKSKLNDSEIESHLREIYSDDNGESLTDFKTIKIKKKRSLGLKLFYLFITLLIVAGVVLAVFKYIKNNQDIASVLKINISAPEKVILGEDFMYEIEYKNTSNYNLNDVILEINYPDNFILAEIYSIDQTDDNKTWKIDNLGANLGGIIKIRGKIINKEGSNNLLTVKATYGINGLSSSFSKDSLNSVVMGSLPFQVKEDYYTTVLVDEEYPLNLTIKDFPVEKINKFIISFSGPEEIFSVEDITNKKTGTSTETITKVSKIDNFNFLVETSSASEMSLAFKYKIKERKNDQENISWTLKYIDDNGKEFVFLEKQVALIIIKSDLNLNISVNDSSTDTPINFGDTLNYVISYSNKGDKDMEDLVIMAVLKSDFLDWNSLKDSKDGSISRKTISWTASEIPELKKLEPGDSGEIKFSINTVPNYNDIKFGQDLNVTSYAQFSIGNIEDFSDEEDHLNDNSSNTIVNKLNSDLSIKEEVLYFDDNNIPVGSGPLPPVVGERTSFKYYWTLKNSLHEIKDLKIELALPQYVIWDNNFNISAGNLEYDQSNNKVIFSISRWPVGVETVDVNFSVSVIPTDSQYNKIIILSSGSSLSAIDAETNTTISKTTSVKTSKLEDDIIASYNNDGRVK
ncbi:MAG TPA: hypothetical protein PLE28_00050 [bacterium]|nr:hypothetical protein [bacterium]